MPPLKPTTIERYWPSILIAVLLILLLALFHGLATGTSDIGYSGVLAWLLGKSSEQATVVIEALRLPRALLALLAGSILACTGAITQSLFRNPLADPSLIGVSAGASAGASTVIVLLNQAQWGLWGLSLVSFGAFTGGILTVLIVYRVANAQGSTSVSTMLLAGLGVSFIAGSLSSIFEYLANNDMLRQMSLWRMGGLDSADYPRVIILSFIALLLCFIVPRYTRILNAFLLGESEARHLGIDTEKTKRLLIVCIALGVGTTVALIGTIAFIGLIVPHLIRMLTGPNHRFLLPLSAATGALLLLIADTIARIVIAPAEMPVGIITSLIGAPLFIFLLRRRYHYGLH